MKRAPILSLLLLALATTATAQESLGDAARRIKKEKEQAPTEQAAKEAKKSAKTYTNDNMPSGGTLNVVGKASGGSSAGRSNFSSTGRGNFNSGGGPFAGAGSSSSGDAESQRKNEEDFAAAARRCRENGGTWRETTDMLFGRIRGYCSFEEKK